MMERRQRDFLWVLAYFYLFHGRPAKAAALYAVLDVLAPGDPVVTKSLATALLESGQYDKSLAVLDRLAALGEADESVLLLRARALAAGGHADEAADAVDRFYAAKSSA